MTRHDARWSALMVLVIVMGAVMLETSPVLGVIQMVLGTLSLGTKLMKLVRKD